MARIGRNFIITGITALALAAGIGVASAQASPSAAVAPIPAPYPDNGTNAVEIGNVWGDAGNPMYVVKGRNIAGTMASYQFGTNNAEPGNRQIALNVTLSGDTGDSVSVYEQDPQQGGALVLVGSGTHFTVAPVANGGIDYVAYVSGGIKGELFTLRLAAVPA
jgi:hypothetical protein